MNERLKKRTYVQLRPSKTAAWSTPRGYRRVWQTADGSLHFLNERGVECSYPRGQWRLA